MTILVVDDQPNLVRVTAVALRMLDCTTHTASTVAKADQILSTQQIDAVFLDVNLGGESGFEFLSTLVARPNPVPVVMFSAHALDEIVAEARQRGALDCLMKPFSLEDLRTQLARIAAHRAKPSASPAASSENPT